MVVKQRHHANDLLYALFLVQVSFKSCDNVLWISTNPQISVTNERISKLEQDKEHWMLESRLLQVKYERESKVCFVVPYMLEVDENCEMARAHHEFFSK